MGSPKSLIQRYTTWPFLHFNTYSNLKFLNAGADRKRIKDHWLQLHANPKTPTYLIDLYICQVGSPRSLIQRYTTWPFLHFNTYLNLKFLNGGADRKKVKDHWRQLHANQKKHPHIWAWFVKWVVRNHLNEDVPLDHPQDPSLKNKINWIIKLNGGAKGRRSNKDHWLQLHATPQNTHISDRPLLPSSG